MIRNIRVLDSEPRASRPRTGATPRRPRGAVGPDPRRGRMVEQAARQMWAGLTAK